MNALPPISHYLFVAAARLPDQTVKPVSREPRPLPGLEANPAPKTPDRDTPDLLPIWATRQLMAPFRG
ncbi:MAG TPA: hypothetical protein VG167_04380 [Verrucomicrobiae bacterium]|nr:hypothetical protein [Verrucomicrobiae bacterium]